MPELHKRTLYCVPRVRLGERLCLAVCPLNSHPPTADNDEHTFTVDEAGEFQYENFYQDFGPLNLSMLYRYCMLINRKLKSPRLQSKKIVHYTCCTAERRSNAAYLIGSYAIIYQHLSAEQVWTKFAHLIPPVAFLPYRDASSLPSVYDLLLKDVFSGVSAALRLGWLDFGSFDVNEYEFYERVENGDFNWIVPGKLLAFCGPHNKAAIVDGYPHFDPETYFSYFNRKHVTGVVRLNKKMYESSRFTDAGFDHLDLFFVDGSTPTFDIVQRFIDFVERSPGAVAVHCKAGLGRTGTLIACWMMKNYHLTAAECMAWIRICRPGSVIGPQQPYLVAQQETCWGLGRRSRCASPLPSAQDLDRADKRRRSLRSAQQQLSTLVSAVDEIQLDEKDSLLKTNPPVTNLDFNANNLETRVDDKGHSQGDRLNEAKLHRIKRTTSKTMKRTVPSQPLTVLSTASSKATVASITPRTPRVTPRTTTTTTPVYSLRLRPVRTRVSTQLVNRYRRTAPPASPAPRAKHQRTSSPISVPVAAPRRTNLRASAPAHFPRRERY